MYQREGEVDQNNNQIKSQNMVNVTFYLKLDSMNQEELNENVVKQDAYVYYYNWKDESIQFKNCKMELFEDNIWSAQIELNPNSIYKYYYQISTKSKIKKESQTRYFKYEEKCKMAIDEWNKVWCLYRYQVQDISILDFYQIKIKDFNKQSFQSFDFSNNNELGICYLECSEILKFQNQQKRQFAFINKYHIEQMELSNQFDPKQGISYVNNFVQHKFTEDIILNSEQEGRMQRFISEQQNNRNQDSIEVNQQIQQFEIKINMKESELKNYKLQLQNETNKNKDSQAKIQKLENKLQQLQYENSNLQIELQETVRRHQLDLYYVEQNKNDQFMKQLEEKCKDFQNTIEQIKKSENELLKKQQQKMDEEQQSLQKKSQELVKYYMDKLEDTNQQLRNYELKNIHYVSDDITISINQDEIPDQFVQQILDLSQKIQDYSDTENKLKNEVKEMITINQNQKRQINTYQNKMKKLDQLSNESQEKLGQCEKNLEKAIQESKLLNEGNELQKQKYQKALQHLKQQFNQKQVELDNFIKAFKELEEKLEQEQQKNIKLQQDLEFTIKSSEERRQSEFNSLMESHNKEIKQIQDQNQQQLLFEKEQYEENQKRDLMVMRNNVICDVFDQVELVILTPYFNHQQRYHENVLINFRSEIERIIKENISNFMTPINQLQYRQSLIQEEQLQDCIQLAQEKHNQLVNKTEQFKKNSDIRNAEILKECFIQYTKECNEIDRNARSINFRNDRDGDQIYELNKWKAILEDKLESVFRLLNFQQELQEWDQEFQQQKKIITSIVLDYKRKQHELNQLIK